MNKINPDILIINTGSPGIKMALYEINELPVLKLSGKTDKIGSGYSDLSSWRIIQKIISVYRQMIFIQQRLY